MSTPSNPAGAPPTNPGPPGNPGGGGGGGKRPGGPGKKPKGSKKQKTKPTGRRLLSHERDFIVKTWSHLNHEARIDLLELLRGMFGETQIPVWNTTSVPGPPQHAGAVAPVPPPPTAARAASGNVSGITPIGDPARIPANQAGVPAVATTGVAASAAVAPPTPPSGPLTTVAGAPVIRRTPVWLRDIIRDIPDVIAYGQMSRTERRKYQGISQKISVALGVVSRGRTLGIPDSQILEYINSYWNDLPALKALFCKQAPGSHLSPGAQKSDDEQFPPHGGQPPPSAGPSGSSEPMDATE